MIRLALVVLFATSACRYSLDDESGDGGDDDPSGTQCEINETSATCREAVNHSNLKWIEQNIFVQNCGGRDCHSTATPAPGGGLILDVNSHAALVDRDSMFGSGRKLVVPGDVKKSYLMVLIRGIRLDEADPSPAPAPPSDPGYMPVNNLPICCQKIDAIARWIMNGAPND